jgi:hypothetical protein
MDQTSSISDDVQYVPSRENERILTMGSTEKLKQSTVISSKQDTKNFAILPQLITITD